MPVHSTPDRLYKRVANSLARDITGGNFEVGSRLPPERDLAKRFDVSRPTIREAIIALELIGLVQVRKGSGVYVLRSGNVAGDIEELDIGPFELIEARMLFEAEVAALAARLITEEQLEELSQLLEQMKAENLREDGTEQADRAFHLTIARATKNSAIVSTLERLWDVRYHSPLCVSLMQQVRARGWRPAIEEHETILKALRTGSSEKARSAMRTHLSSVTESLLQKSEIETLEQARASVAHRRDRYGKSEQYT